MKSNNIHTLRASVEHQVWSSTKGANKVLQDAWEARKPGEKVMVLCSFTHKYGWRGVGWLYGNEGMIPTRWIVAKDIEFSAFDDMTYNNKPVTQLRHGNT